MNKRTLIAVTFYLALFLSMTIRANAGAAPPEDLVKADWSVNAAHNLASNPLSLDAIEDFTRRALGHDEEDRVDVCEFRFADLRNSGNLSLITTVNPGGRQIPECNEIDIFDRTSTGFELYSSGASDHAVGHDLANSVLDINHDGRHELVLWGNLAPYVTGYQGPGSSFCYAEWPLIFAWTGNGYSEVGDQYKDYYRNYLKSVEARLAAYSSLLAPAAAQTANPVPMAGGPKIAGETQAETSPGPGGESPAVGPALIAPAPTPEAAPIPRWVVLNRAHRDYPCARIEAAKTEAFLGVDSAATMSAAIKDSESNDPNKRILAAVIFSYLGTQEAKQDLKTLSNDTDSWVAGIAKMAASSTGEDPGPADRIMKRYPDVYVHLSEPRQSRP